MKTITLSNGTVVRKTNSGELVASTPTGYQHWETPENSFVLQMFHRLLELSWIPVTERRPTEEDADSFGQVDWSDDKDVWESSFEDEDKTATHWRRIVLP